jgi:hypothetical protein
MIEEYAVGVSLRLHDLLSAPLLKISGTFKEIDAMIIRVNKNLKGLSVESDGIRAIATASKSLGQHLGTADRQAASLEKHLAAIKALGPNALIPVPVSRGDGGGKGGHGGGVHVGPGGVGMSAATLGLGDALLPAAGAAAVIYGEKKLFDAAKDYEQVFQRFKALNLGDTVNAEADKLARGAHKFGVSSTDLMKVLSESVGLFGSFEEAKKYAPKIAELARANSGIFQGATGDLDEHGIMGLLKFIDRRGGFKDEAAFNKNVNLAEKLVTGSGGRIKFSDLDQFSQRGGTAFRGLSDEGVMGMAGLLIEQGGNAAGVGFMSMYQNLVAGRTPKKTMALMQEMGLGKLEYQEHATVGGKSLKSLIMTGIKDSELLQADPRRWYVETFLPALAAKGITKESDIVKTTNDLLSNRTASNQGTIFTTQDLQLLRDYNLVKNAKSADQVTGMYKTTGAGAEEDFQAAWSEFKVEWGRSVLPQVTEMLRGAAELLRSMSGFHDKHKGLIDTVEGEAKPGFLPNTVRKFIDLFTHPKTGVTEERDVQTVGSRSDSGIKVVAGHVYLDGHDVGKVMWKQADREASRPQGITSNPDPSRHLMPVGSSGDW